MRTTREHGIRRTLLAAALLAAFAPAWGQDDAVAQLAKPDVGVVSVGAGGITGDPKDRSLFTQYNGLHKDDAYFLLDFDYIVRDDATGTWTIVQGKDLGLDTREVRFLYGPQGQVRTRESLYNVGQDDVPKGKTWYWVGANQPERSAMWLEKLSRDLLPHEPGLCAGLFFSRSQENHRRSARQLPELLGPADGQDK